jgi:two-component system sensor histidine kinase RegB
VTPAHDAAGRKNMVLLIQLRWLAVVGQVATIAAADWLLHIALPLVQMGALLGVLVLLNLFSLLRLRNPAEVHNEELLPALVLDVVALTGQLYLSGGATNPFISLYLLQVTLSAVLLEAWSAWVVAAICAVSFGLLTLFYLPLALPPEHAHELFSLHIQGMFVCFVLDAGLLLVFMLRISDNLRARDTHLADLRQQAAEEDHIVRMGLLASGAAHELGTPLATMSVILNDWKRIPVLAKNPELAQEIDEMEAEVQRCKAIVTGVLRSAGEARGEGTVVTTLKAFLDDTVREWRDTRAVEEFAYDNSFTNGAPIVSDTALKQVICNVLDNAAEASPGWVGLSVKRQADDLVLSVLDTGPGFPAAMLANLGKPYQSTKEREGRGLGLFLVFNVMRKLGGGLAARNRPGGGAEVTLTLPLSALAIGTQAHAG